MSAYKVIQVIGSSPNSWEEAAKTAIEQAGKHVRDLRIAEIEKLDMRIEDNKVMEFRARVNLSFRYEGSPA
jgi:flavin-binding protein dodecin